MSALLTTMLPLGGLLAALALALALALVTGSSGSAGCLSMLEAESRPMHEYGSERVLVNVRLNGCQSPSSLIAEADGEIFSRNAISASEGDVKLVLPMYTGAGAHSLVVLLEEPSGDEIDSIVYTFLTTDWRPVLVWEFPPENYTFKRNSQRFLRFGIEDEGDRARCQVWFLLSIIELARSLFGLNPSLRCCQEHFSAARICFRARKHA